MSTDSDNVIQVQFGSSAPKIETPRKAHEKRIEIDERNREKKQVFESFLDANAIAMLIIDATQPDVRVPEMFREESDLRLNFCLEYRIPEFCVDNVGVRGSLSFSDGFAFCDIPWTRVFAIRDADNGETYMWPEDSPKGPISKAEKPATKPKLKLLTLDED